MMVLILVLVGCQSECERAASRICDVESRKWKAERQARREKERLEVVVREKCRRGMARGDELVKCVAYKWYPFTPSPDEYDRDSCVATETMLCLKGRQ